jgi:hypothetical protein
MTRHFLLSAFILLAGSTALGPSASAQSRHALVVGVDDYRNVPKLSRAVADARAMRDALQALGFRTRSAENPDRAAMSAVIAGFEESLEKGDTAFLFFAGHGVEIAGQNVLLPSDVPDPGRASSGILRDAGFNTAELIERITARGARSAFFVFDACRDNPYARAGNTRAVGAARGLGRAEAPEGVFVLMSAGLNQQALDSLNLPGQPQTDRSPNSVFTRVLLEEMARPGLTHIVMAKAVQTRVRDLARSIDHAQVPAFYDQIIGDVILQPGGAKPQAAAIPSNAVPAPPQPGPQAPSQTAPPSFDLGQRWQVREVSASGPVFDGVWTRTGPRSFAAEWRQVGSREVIRDIIDVESLNGDAVVLYRRGLNGRYFGTLSADGRFVSGHASWYGAGDNWSAATEKEEAAASTGPQAKPPVPRIVVVPRIDANAPWRVREVSASGAVFDGVWTRTGAHTFNAEWRAAGSGSIIRDTIEIERQYGNVVVLYRKSIKGRYFGTISRDGRFIQGHASWYGPGDRWTAEIR